MAESPTRGPRSPLEAGGGRTVPPPHPLFLPRQGSCGTRWSRGPLLLRQEVEESPAAGREELACAVAHSRCRSGYTRCTKAIATIPFPAAFEVMLDTTAGPAPSPRVRKAIPQPPWDMCACLGLSLSQFSSSVPTMKHPAAGAMGCTLLGYCFSAMDNCSRNNFLYTDLAPEELIATKLRVKKSCVFLPMVRTGEQFLGQIYGTISLSKSSERHQPINTHRKPKS